MRLTVQSELAADDESGPCKGNTTGAARALQYSLPDRSQNGSHKECRDNYTEAQTLSYLNINRSA